MPSKNFGNALSKRRIAVSETAENEQTLSNSFGVLGDADQLREELERSSSNLPTREIDIAKLKDNPYQAKARTVQDQSMSDEALEELASSIRENGFFGALLARRSTKNPSEYELAFGHRRREASKRAGLEKLPVKIIELSDFQMARIMASENFARQDLTTLGEANVIGHLAIDQNLTIKEISQIIGKKKGWIEPRLELYSAPESIKKLVEQKPDSLSYVHPLLQINDEEQRNQYIQQILNNELTRNQLLATISSPSPKALLESVAFPANENPTQDIVTDFTEFRTTESSEIPHNLDEVKEDSQQSLDKKKREVVAPATNNPKKLSGDKESVDNWIANIKKLDKITSDMEALIENLAESSTEFERFQTVVERLNDLLVRIVSNS